tara:strand:+ start:135 stop:494 length:360 start_codon:yes stop_codon:yes gene_type:complete
MAFKLGSEQRRIRSSENTPIFRKNLEEGVVAEANMDGSIYIDKDVEPGSVLEKKAIAHEMQHIRDIESGKAAYGKDWVRWKGKTYKRKDGKIWMDGKPHEEGWEGFPWEKVAIKAEKDV